jgi:hypothetical protein
VNLKKFKNGLQPDQNDQQAPGLVQHRQCGEPHRSAPGKHNTNIFIYSFGFVYWAGMQAVLFLINQTIISTIAIFNLEMLEKEL